MRREPAARSRGEPSTLGARFRKREGHRRTRRRRATHSRRPDIDDRVGRRAVRCHGDLGRPPELRGAATGEQIFLLLTPKEFNRSLKIGTDASGTAVVDRIESDGSTTTNAGRADFDINGNTVTFRFPASLGVTRSGSIAANAIVADADGNGFASQTETVPLAALLPTEFPRHDLPVFEVHHRIVDGVSNAADPAVGPEGTMPTDLRVEETPDGLVVVVSMSGAPAPLTSVADGPVAFQALFVEFASSASPLDTEFLVTWIADPGRRAVISAPVPGQSDREIGTVATTTTGNEIRIPIAPIESSLDSNTLIAVRGFVTNEQHNGFESNGSFAPVACLVVDATPGSSTPPPAPAPPLPLTRGATSPSSSLPCSSRASRSSR